MKGGSSPGPDGDSESTMTHSMSSSNNFFNFTNTVNGATSRGSRVTRAVNPSSKQPLWDCPIATEDDVNDAVVAAGEAFAPWSRLTWGERATCLMRARDALLRMHVEMTSLLMQETGKPIGVAKLEIDQSARLLLYYASHPKLEPKVVTDDDEIRMTVRYVPMGVTAAICPSSDPLMRAVGKIAPALITGNTVIIKPSPFAPYSILKFVEQVQRFFPPGVVQALNGDEKLGPLLVDHPGIQKIDFTGSSKTGKKVMAAACRTLKRVSLNLSGNCACIVCPDVDVSVVAPQVAIGAFFNSGQLCLGNRRIYVHEDIYSSFLQRMVDTVRLWKDNPAPSATAMLGPIQNEALYNNIKGIFEDSQRSGHRFALGNGEVTDENGFIIQPAIIDNPPEDSRVVQEEAFGPIVSLLSWKDEEEVISRVNDTKSGLGASVWAGDVERATAIGERIQCGMITINRHPNPIPSGHISGWKESGIGGEWGSEALLSCCNMQTMHCYKMPVAPGWAEAD